jgi:CubicO group peptidase (beta-lactamase class C family)
MLADQGKLHLDDRVVDHLPWFRMADPYVTREMRIRDALAHRSGLGNHRSQHAPGFGTHRLRVRLSGFSPAPLSVKGVES